MLHDWKRLLFHVLKQSIKCKSYDNDFYFIAWLNFSTMLNQLSLLIINRRVALHSDTGLFSLTRYLEKFQVDVTTFNSLWV